jgi:branched-chain amino acid transport system permease protein
VTQSAVSASILGVRTAKWRPDTIQFCIAAVLIWITMVGADLGGNPYWIHIFRLLGSYLSIAVLLNFLYVDAGQTSFGQGAVLGAGAYMAAVLTGLHGVPYPAAAALGVVAAMAAGLLCALPALRVQQYYLGFVTFGVALVFPEMIVAFPDYTEGINGIRIPFPELSRMGVGGVSLLTAMIATVCCAALALHLWIRRTAYGRALRVAASSPEAAQALGISPGWMRFTAFMITSAGTGVAAAFFCPVVEFAGPTAFDLDLSMLFFFAIIVGGRGHLLGPVLGVALLFLVPNVLLADIVKYRLMIYGGIALGVMLVMPNGLVGSFEDWRRRKRRHVDPLDLRIMHVMDEGTTRPAVAPSGPPAIQVVDGTKRFGHVVALDAVSVAVRRGEIHGLIGANGSGKTSLLNVLSGFSQLDSGQFAIGGIWAHGYSPHRIARLGLGRTFQMPRVFPSLTTWENLQIGLDARPASMPPIAAATLHRLSASLSGHRVDLVPHGQRRLLELLRVSLQGAAILLLDEPAAGLSTRERAEFANLLTQLRDRHGKTIVLVEHDLDLVMGIADRVTVLEAGRVVASGSPAEIAAEPRVRGLFVAAHHA